MSAGGDTLTELGADLGAGTQALFGRYGRNYRWFATVTVMLGSIATVLSATIVNVAIPDIMLEFDLHQDQAQWLSTGFLAAMTACMLLTAWSIERFGQRNTFLLGMGLFTAGSALGALAPSGAMVIAARVLQGAAAGLVAPQAMATVFRVFPPDRRGRAMGIYGIGVILAPALGPTVGGVLVDQWSWHYVFLLPLPACAAGALMALYFLPGREHSEPPRRFDAVGFALLVGALVGMLSGLADGQRLGWHSARVLTPLLGGMALGTAFVFWQRFSRRPLLDVALFTHLRFSAACLVAFIVGAGIYGSTYLIPLFVQLVQDYSPTRAGLLLMPAGLVLGVVFPLSGRLSDQVGPTGPILAGLALFALSAVLLAAAGASTGFAWLATWVCLGRIGLGLLLPSLNMGALRVLPMTLVNQGSGAVNFMRQLGGAFGVNALAILLEMRVDHHAVQLLAAQGREIEAGLLAEIGARGYDAGSDAALQTLADRAQVLAFHDSFYVTGLIFGLAVLPAWLFGRRGRAADTTDAASA